MIFKEGDRVICIDNNLSKNQLILNKQYIIKGCIKNSKRSNRDTVELINVNTQPYYASRFILDKNYYRKEKIKQLRNGV
jgi:hypothetical protein